MTEIGELVYILTGIFGTYTIFKYMEVFLI